MDHDGDGQGVSGTVRKWGRSVSLLLDHGGTVREVGLVRDKVRVMRPG